MTGTFNIGDVVGYVDREPEFRAGTWHLAMARSGREERAADVLRRHRFEVYFPMTRVMKPLLRRQMSKRQRAMGATVKKAVLRPIFPSYMFVRFDEGDAWRSHFDHAGVFGLLCAGDLPARVPDEMVQNIRDKEIDGAVPGAVLMRQIFSIGETVVIRDGPFSSFTATIEQLPRKMVEQLDNGQIDEIDESDRVSLAVHIFGRLTPMQATLGQIAKI